MADDVCDMLPRQVDKVIYNLAFKALAHLNIKCIAFDNCGHVTCIVGFKVDGKFAAGFG